MLSIPGNIQDDKTIEAKYVVSIRWRSQGGSYALGEWVDIAGSAFEFSRLYDSYSSTRYQTTPLLRMVGSISQNFDLTSESTFTFEVDNTRELAAFPGFTFASFYSDEFPPEYADVFVSVVLGRESEGTQTTQLLWAGAIEDAQQYEDYCSFIVVDQTRKLLIPLTETINDTTFPDAESGATGKYLPFPVGSTKGFVPPATVDQKSSALREELTDSGTASYVIHLDSSDNFPDSGIVVINDEIIAYGRKDHPSIGENTLDQLTRGYASSTTASHAAQSMVFRGTGAAVGSETVYGPVFSLSGHPFSTSVERLQAHSMGGKSSFVIPSADWVSDSSAEGLTVGLKKRWPQDPSQREDSVWYAVEMDDAGSFNQTAVYQPAAGANASFSENSQALVFSGNRLSLVRSNDNPVENIGASRIKKVYALAEFGNISNPITGNAPGTFVPGNGGQTALYLRTGPGTSQRTFLGSLDEEGRPVAADENSAHRTLTTRGITDPHTHAIGGGASIGSGEENVDVMGNLAWHYNPYVGYQKHTYDTGVTTEDTVSPSQVDDIVLGGNESSWVFPQSASFWEPEFIDDPDYLDLCFHKCVGEQFDFAAAIPSGGSVSVETSGGGSSLVGYNGGGQGVVWKQMSGFTAMSTYYFSESLPYVFEFNLNRGSGNVSNSDGAVALRNGTVRLSQINTDGVHQMVSTSSLAAFSQSAWRSSGSSFNQGQGVSFNSPNPSSAAIPTQFTVMTKGNGSSGNWALKTAAGVLLGTVASSGQVVQFPSGVTMMDLHGCKIEAPAGGSGTVYWCRLMIQYQGDLTTQDTAPQRTTSLMSFDITDHFSSEIAAYGWGAFQADATDTYPALEVESSTSTGSNNGIQFNNDSLWAFRLSYLVEAAPPVTDVADSVSADFSGLTAAGGSRYTGDLAYRILTDAQLGNIGGSEYFPGEGWALASSFESSGSGPTTISNAVFTDPEDTAGLVYEMSESALHSLYWERGRLKMKPILSSGWPTASQTFASVDLLKAPRKVRRPADTIINKVEVKYNVDFVEGGFSENIEVENSDSQTKFGKRRPERADLLSNNKSNLDDETIQSAQAQAVADSLSSRFGEVVSSVEWETGLNGLDVELGDIVEISTTSLSATKVEVTHIRITPGAGAIPDKIQFQGLVRT